SLHGQQIRTSFLINGNKGWLNRQGKTNELPAQLSQELREAVNLLRATHLASLLDPGEYQMSTLPEQMIDGQRTAGVRIVSPGYRDMNLFFSADTGLLAKVERRTIDGQGREVVEERFLMDYQPVQGILTPRKVLVKRSGEKFIEAQVTEMRYLE